MKQALKLIVLATVLFSACKKSKNTNPSVSAVNGCVVCTVQETDISSNAPTTIPYKHDTTFCNVPDEVIADYKKWHTSTVSYALTPSTTLTRKLTTTCVNK